jgi:hypothetical protein
MRCGRARADAPYPARDRQILLWAAASTRRLRPGHRDENLRSLLDRGTPSPPSGISDEKRIDVLLEAFAHAVRPGARLRRRRRPGSRGALRAPFLGEPVAPPRGSTPASLLPEHHGPRRGSDGASGLPTPRSRAPAGCRPRPTGLVPPTRPARLRSGLGRLVGDPALRQSLGEGALAVASRRTWKPSFAELRDAYRIAVHGTPSELRTRLAA